MFVSVFRDVRPRLIEYLKLLYQQGWSFHSTEGTHDYLAKHGITSRFVYKISDHRKPSAAELIVEHKVGFMLNIPQNRSHQSSDQKTDGFIMRRLAIDHHMPLITNLQSAQLMLHALTELYEEMAEPKSWQTFMKSK